MVLGHVAGVPVEEALVAAPGVAAAVGVAGALLRARVRGMSSRVRHTRDTGWSRTSTVTVDDLDHPVTDRARGTA